MKEIGLYEYGNYTCVIAEMGGGKMSSAIFLEDEVVYETPVQLTEEQFHIFVCGHERGFDQGIEVGMRMVREDIKQVLGIE